MTQEQINYVKKHYHCKLNKDLAREVGCSVHQLKRLAKKHRLRKSFNVQFPEIPEKSQVNDLKVIRKTKKKSKRSFLYECECKCGRKLLVKAGLLRNGKAKSCVSCSGTAKGGCGSISGTFWSKIKHRASVRGIGFTVSIEYAAELFRKQGGKCALSGIPISLPNRDNGMKITASLDRISSTKPYEEGNVQWVHKIINNMKWELSQEDFVNFCQKVVDYNGTSSSF